MVCVFIILIDINIILQNATHIWTLTSAESYFFPVNKSMTISISYFPSQYCQKKYKASHIYNLKVFRSHTENSKRKWVKSILIIAII